METDVRWFRCRKRTQRLRNFRVSLKLSVILFVSFSCLVLTKAQNCSDSCTNGQCESGQCVCFDGWLGDKCDTAIKCSGRVRLNSLDGFITDGYENYVTSSKCFWLLDPNVENVTLRLRLDEFATECSWDHLYIYDGDSVYSPMVAAFSGILDKDEESNSNSSAEIELYFRQEVVAHSGKAFIYFYSDAGYVLTGFNISYSNSSCPQQCFGQGDCIDGTCHCEEGWTGIDCSRYDNCLNNCSGHGYCNKDTSTCECYPGYHGDDCGTFANESIWSVLPPALGDPSPRSSHQAAVQDNYMWIAGGESFVSADYEFLSKYNLDTHEWVEVTGQGEDKPEHGLWGHSLVHYKDLDRNDQLWLFGGRLGARTVNDLWRFDIGNSTWEKYADSYWQDFNMSEPLAVFGHTATVVDDKMIVIFGNNPAYGYVSTVQEFDLETKVWTRSVNVTGALVKGTFGHSAVYDNSTGFIYVYGGVTAVSDPPNAPHSKAILTAQLLRYDPRERSWWILVANDSPRFLHSAAIIDGTILFYGGNTHNDSSSSLGAKCFSSNFLAYDTLCEKWYHLPEPEFEHIEAARYGHSAISYAGKMYVFGGFSGVHHNTILSFHPGDCSHGTEEECERVLSGVKCVWHSASNSCLVLSEALETLTIDDIMQNCPDPAPTSHLCWTFSGKNCMNCLESSYDCIWCDNSCTDFFHCDNETDHTPMYNSSGCTSQFMRVCRYEHTCAGCYENYPDNNCKWTTTLGCDDDVFPYGNGQCKTPCSEFTSCEFCLSDYGESCMWCESQQACISRNAYFTTFAYGQCLEWQTSAGKCSEMKCSGLKTCDSCLNHPGCGWCDAGDFSGLGTCMNGALDGPFWTKFNNSTVNQCSVPNWHYVDCPACNCNGHGYCPENETYCVNCTNNTEGDNCETCVAGWYGSPQGHGICEECVCYHGLNECDRKTGKCTCTTKGVYGHTCDSCDEGNSFYGDAIDHTCFYNISVGLSYTFSYSGTSDRYITDSNFMCKPEKTGTDVAISMNCTSKTPFNISYSTDSIPEKFIYAGKGICSPILFTGRLSKYDYPLGRENFTIYIYFYNMNPPLDLRIAIIQPELINIGLFFAVFFGCFLSLLLISAIVWKVKDKYEHYRRRQRMVIEMEKLASRPVGQIFLEVQENHVGKHGIPIEDNDSGYAEVSPSRSTLNSNTPSLEKQSMSGSYTALEMCADESAGILTTVIQLPTGRRPYAPYNQPGIAFGSTLVRTRKSASGVIDVLTKDAKGKKKKSKKTAETRT